MIGLPGVILGAGWRYTHNEHHSLGYRLQDVEAELRCTDAPTEDCADRRVRHGLVVTVIYEDRFSQIVRGEVVLLADEWRGSDQSELGDWKLHDLTADQVRALLALPVACVVESRPLAAQAVS